MSARPDWLADQRDRGPHRPITARQLELEACGLTIVYDERVGPDNDAWIQSDLAVGREAMR